MQLLLLTLDEGYLLTDAPPDLKHGVAPLGPPAPVQPLLLRRGFAPLGGLKLLHKMFTKFLMCLIDTSKHIHFLLLQNNLPQM